MAESELVVTRQDLSRLDDLIYIVACAVEDVQRDLAGEHDPEDVGRALAWLLESCLPLAELSRQGRP